MENCQEKHIVDRIIDNIISVYKENMDISDDQCAILRYSIRLLISSILSFSLTLGLAALIGNFKNVAIIIIVVALYRSFSGGAHCSSMGNCAIYGALTLNALGFFVKIMKIGKSAGISMIIFVFIFSLWAVSRYAPADTPGKPISTKVKQKKLKRLSLAVVCLWGFGCIAWYTNFNSISEFLLAPTVAVVWQSFTLTKSGYKFCGIFDFLINFMRFRSSSI